MNFEQTRMGKIFYEGTMPRLVTRLTSIANSMEAKIVRGYKAENSPKDEVYLRLTDMEQDRRFGQYTTVYVIVDSNGLTDAKFDVYYETYEDAKVALTSASKKAMP